MEYFCSLNLALHKIYFDSRMSLNSVCRVMQESICSDAASFDLPSSLLSACISEAKSCIDISIRRRDVEKSSDMTSNPDNFAILRGIRLMTGNV